MQCFMCKGSLEDKPTSFVVELDHCIIVIKNVPSQVCRQCGEVSYNTEVSQKIEQVVNRVKSMVSDIAVFEYSKIVA